MARVKQSFLNTETTGCYLGNSFLYIENNVFPGYTNDYFRKCEKYAKTLIYSTDYY